MMKSMNRFAALALVTGLLAAPAYADGTTTATTEQVAPSLLDNFRSSYSLDFYGPSITDPLAAVQPDADTGARSESVINADHTLGLGYKVGSYTISANAAVNTPMAREKDYTWYDPWLKVSNGSLYKNGDLNISGDARIYFPVSAASQAKDQWTSVRLTQSIGYDIGKLNLSLALFERGYFYSHPAKGRKSNPTALRVYTGPQVGYQILPNLQAWVLFEFDGRTKLSEGMGSFYTAGTDFEIGASWDITPKISFTPYLDMKTSNTVAADTTTLQANLTLRLL